MDIKEILALTPSERILLMEQLWDSLDPKEVKISKAQKAELDLRLDKLENTQFFTWEAVKRQLTK